jgi:hypothetical protein
MFLFHKGAKPLNFPCLRPSARRLHLYLAMMTVELAKTIDPQSIEFVSPLRSMAAAAETLLPKRLEDVAPTRGLVSIGRMLRQALVRVTRNYFNQSAETPDLSAQTPDDQIAPEQEADGETVYTISPDYGGWKLTEETKEESIDCALTKAEVEAKARHLAEQQGGPCRIRIHDRDGNLESEEVCE